jgi:CRP-like cAMP-binding protein
MGGVDPAFLAGLEVFGGCSAAELADLSSRLELLEEPSNVLLLREGEPATSFLLLAAGRVVADVGGRDVGAAGAGSILGELALLGGSPRTASVRTVTPVRAFAGDRATFELLVGLPGVGEWVELTARRRLAVDVPPVGVTLSDGGEVAVRPVVPDDRSKIRDAESGFSDASRYRRFFALSKLDDRLLSFLTEVDYVTSFVWIALDVGDPDGPAVGGARYTRLPGTGQVAEIAFSILDRHQGRGLGTLLLGLLGVAADEHDLTRFTAVVQVDNRAMRTVLDRAAAHWATGEAGTVTATLDVDGALGLLDDAASTAARELVRSVSISSRLLLIVGADDVP